MHPALEFSRSGLLEFVRSPLLERGHLPTTVIGSITVAIHNDVKGFYGPSGSRWIIYPRLRSVTNNAFGTEEVLWEFSNPTQNFNASPNRILVSQTPGWLIGSWSNIREVSRTATTLTWTADQGGGTKTVEGAPFDAEAYRDLFWDSCEANQGIWPQPPQAANPTLFFRIHEDGAMVSASTIPGQFPLFFDPQSRIEASFFDWNAAGTVNDPNLEAFRTSILLRFFRRRYALNPGEAVNGAFGDFDFDGISTGIDCTRGITEGIEDVIPPRIPQATLDAIDLTMQNVIWRATSERRLIPPQQPHPLIIC